MAAKDLDEKILDQIDRWSLSDWLKRRRQNYFDSPRMVCADRARLAMESWKQTEGEDIEIRRAKLLEKILNEIPIVIHDDQLIAGSETTAITGAHPWLDISGDYIRELTSGQELGLMNPVAKGTLSAEDRKTLVECARYFDGKTGGDAARRASNALMGTWYNDWIEAGAIARTDVQFANPFLGIAMWDRVINEGLRSIIDKAKAGIESLKEHPEIDVDKLYFWQAVIIVCEAACNYARRHAKLAREMAQKEQNAERRKQLEEIATACDWVPENPARTFFEAAQAKWILFIALRLENPGFSPQSGRIDQYLYPYFKRDIQEGRLTVEKAADLVGEIIQAIERVFQSGDDFTQDYIHSSSVQNNLNLGGLHADGEDACNELTYLFLHAEGEVKCTSPWITLRWHPGTPHRVVLKAMECNRKVKGGQPGFVGDVHVLEYLTNIGVPREDAREYGVVGCIQIVPRGRHVSFIGGVPANEALWLDVTLHNGVAAATGKKIGLETGDPRSFKTFDELLEAYKKQLRFAMTRLIWECCTELDAIVKNYRHPLASAVLPNCVETGYNACFLDKYPDLLGYLMDRAIVDVGDCLTAIKTLVYQEKKLTMDELLTALDSNFEGERGEEIRQMCVAAPKFGNMIDEADLMVRAMGTFSAQTVIEASKSIPGAPLYRSYRPGGATHYWMGKAVGALPNGRKAFEPLYDASLSPMRGADKRGPTGTLQSVLKAGFKETPASIFNQKFSATAMQSPESLEKLAILTETFLGAGGSQIQYNVVDREMLLEAQKKPEQYQDLVIRVAGYSAYFVQLTTEIQNDIIARTEQEI